MPHFVSNLIRKIKHWRLDERTPFQNKSGIDWHQILVMLEAEMISEPMARDLLQVIVTDIEHLKDFPDFLHKLPEREQWYRDGDPDVPLGSLVGISDLKFGISFKNAVFVQITGQTGYGKSHIVRALLHGIENYNQENPDDKKVLIICDRNGLNLKILGSAAGIVS